MEVLGLLLALKLWMPDKIWLVRGNHEDRNMNEIYGFKDACLQKLGPQFGLRLYDGIHRAFDELPMACVIEKRVLVVHGGIGDGLWTLDRLKSVKRPITADSLSKDENTWLHQILWSDPIEDSKTASPDVFGVHESPRSRKACEFAWDVTKKFCARNGLSLVVRSHQCKEHSIGFEFMHENLLSRVFSARDYEEHGNDGAVLMITKVFDQDAQADMLRVRPQVLRSTTKVRAEILEKQNSKLTPRLESEDELSAADVVGKSREQGRKMRRLPTSELMGGLNS